MYPKVVQVIPQDDYTVYVYFEDGKIVLFDAKPLLDSEVFSPLKDLTFFRNRCTVLNDTLAWDLAGGMDPTACADIDPFVLHALPAVKEKNF